ncbi:MAG: NHLP bacteriocin system secretion protein [Desulfobacteraceae bacterium]|nr:NHLP bacteriocin system secretion protein [Desulfobacteraceae bacterium]
MLFRGKALVKLASPEQVDESLHILPRQSRMAWLTGLGLLLFALFWGFLGYVPEIGHGRGILVSPGSVVSLQVRASGLVLDWYVGVGDLVEKDQVLGILDQSEIEQELDHQIDKLAEVESRNRDLAERRKRYTELARKAIERKRQNLQARIEFLESYIRDTRDVSERLHKGNLELIEQQRKSMMEAKQRAVAMRDAMEGRLESYKRLRKEDLASEESLRTARNNRDDSLIKLREFELNLQELNLKLVQLTESHLNTQELISTRENNLVSLRLQARELDNRRAQLDKSDSEFAFQQENELNEVRRSVERARKQLGLNREIRSEYAGRILELSAAEGQYVNEGQRVAQIDTRSAASELYALTYFHAREGKRLFKGMPVQVSPSVVLQREHGSIVGHVEFVSKYPVTVDSVVNYVGNSKVAERLIQDNRQIEVFVRLEPNGQNPSGYAWTSGRGPEVEITAGTLADVGVRVEKRAPITFVVPKLKTWGGL